MKKYNSLFVFLLMGIFMLSFSSAVVRTITTDAYTDSYTTSVKVGLLLRSNSYDFYIQNFTKSNNVSATIGYITHANLTVISQVSFIGNVADFGNIQLSGAGRYYYLLYDNGGSTYSDWYKTGSFPYYIQDANVTARYLSLSNGTIETTGILKIGLSNVSLDIAPTVNINSPTNNSVYLVNTSVLFNFTSSIPTGSLYNATLFINGLNNESFTFGSSSPTFTPLLSPSEKNAGNTVATTLNGTYEELFGWWYLANYNTTQIINGALWTPWYDNSQFCSVAHLHNNDWASPNMTYNSMVTDEFSQVALIISMSNNETRMEQFYKTLSLINGSSAGTLPSWRVKRNDTAIINNPVNDTASDADARIITALYNAANNSFFSSANKSKYFALANAMASDFVKYDLIQTSRFSSLNLGNITYWLASGRNARDGGFGSGDFVYTGYFQDAAISMLQAYENTGNATYLNIARNITLNYLEAAKYTNNFTTSPGKSFKWTNTSGLPVATCTNTCSPDQWDSVDAPRIYGLGEAEYWFNLTGNNFTILSDYMAKWRTRYMGNTNSVPIQFYANGSTSASNQSGYFAQGLESLGWLGAVNNSAFNSTLRNALGHADSTPKSMDFGECMGIYGQAFSMKSLGVAIGRNLNSFGSGLTLGNAGPITNTTIKYFSANGIYNFNVQACGLTVCSNSSLQMFNISSTWIEDAVYGPTSALYGDIDLFGVNINTTGGVIVNASNFIYNGTVYSIGSINNSLNSANLTKPNFLIPNIAGVIPWYINFTFNDSTSGQMSSRNITVQNIALGNCTTGGYNVTLYNFTVVNEDTKVNLNGTGDNVQGEVNLVLSSYDGLNLVSNYSQYFNKTNPFAVCFNRNTTDSNYLLNATIKYQASGYDIEYYNIRNENINYTDLYTNITLYDLNSSVSTEFKLTFKDSNYIISPDTLILVNRNYPGDGISRTVELPITDTNGQAVIHLIRNDVVYTLVAVKNGEIIGTLTDIVAFCDDIITGNCVINFNAQSQTQEVFNYYSDVGIIASTPSYDTPTKTFSLTFSTPSGTASVVNFSVSRANYFGVRSLCSSQVTSASGTLTCDTSATNNDNSTLITTLLVNGIEAQISYLNQNSAGYSQFGYIIAFFLLLSMVIMMGSTSKEGIILGVVLGVFSSLSLGLITGSAIGLGSLGVWLVLVALIFLWKLNKGKIQ